MIDSYAVIGVYATLTAALFWTLPGDWICARKWLVAGSSGLFVVFLDPWAIVFLLWNSLLVFSFGGLANPTTKHYWLTLGLLVLPFVLLRVFGHTLGVVVVVGLAFAVLRSVGAVNEYYKSKRRCSVVESILLNVFFPVLLSGPIIATRTVYAIGAAARLTFHNLIEFAGRFSLGFFKISFLGEGVVLPLIVEMSQGLSDGSLGPMSLIAYGLCRFAYIYLNFSGFCDIAVGVGHVFGLELPENFRWPGLSRNLQNFWQRWHLTLGSLVTRAIYLPMIRQTGRCMGPSSSPSCSSAYGMDSR